MTLSLGNSSVSWPGDSKSMRVLIAEDEPISRRLLESCLRQWNYEAVVTNDGASAWEVLQQEDSPRLAVLDWMMPQMDGSQVCRELRRRPRQHYVYVILLTGKSQKGDVVEGLDSGADDYLVKPFDRSELKARLTAGARIIELQERLLVAQEALREQATHDALTGAFNRAAILEILQRELARSDREGRPLCLSMVDIDHFKSINDSFGHSAGDAVLRDIIKRLCSAMRPYDSIGRYGGEEFLIVAPGCDLSHSLTLAERLRESIAHEHFRADSHTIPVTVSLGLTVCEDKGSADSLIRAADEALYRAKRAGRNRIEVAGTVDQH